MQHISGHTTTYGIYWPGVRSVVYQWWCALQRTFGVILCHDCAESDMKQNSITKSSIGLREKIYGRHQCHEYACIVSKMLSIYSFCFAQMVAILNFTHYAMSKVHHGHITMSGIPENLIVDTLVKNPFFWSKIMATYRLTLHKWRLSWILPPFRRTNNSFFWKPIILTIVKQLNIPGPR